MSEGLTAMIPLSLESYQIYALITNIDKFDILIFLDDDSQTDSSQTTARPEDSKSTASTHTTPGK